jgi:hypothetical protein|nr:MAG TPA: protein of unknown function DUF891 [Caudoviricetes sp.]
MNKDEVLSYLQDYFASIDASEELLPELLALIAESGVEDAVFRLILLRLRILLALGVSATQHKEFEPIKSGLYSMHLAGKGFNIRILYSFLPNRKPVLLLAFYEREGKRKTDYTPYIDPALSRLQRFKEEF